jgi:hypothetical protein
METVSKVTTKNLSKIKTTRNRIDILRITRVYIEYTRAKIFSNDIFQTVRVIALDFVPKFTL